MEEKFEKEIREENQKEDSNRVLKENAPESEMPSEDILEENHQESEEHEIPERANYAEELLEIIRGDEPSLSKLDKLDDYHENDIASALEFLESDERRRLYSLPGRRQGIGHFLLY